MRPAMRGRLARSLFVAVLALLASAPAVMAASSSSGGSGGTSGFVPFHGFPPFTQHSGFVPFTATTSPNAPFPRGLCCVTAAPAPPVIVQIVENPPPVPAQKPAPKPVTSVATENGVTVIRGGVSH